jgi:hypothetical protein
MKRLITDIFVSILTIFSLGCSDYAINKIVEVEPDIEVSPLSHDCGYLFSGQEVCDFSVRVANVGNEVLEIDDIFLNNNSSNFNITSEIRRDLEVGSNFDVNIRYDPKTFEINNDKLKILSNDPDERIVEVELKGAGDAPVIKISPDYFSFDNVFVGCDDRVEVVVSNEGNVDLTITDIEFFTSIPDDIMLDNLGDVTIGLPITLQPDDEIDLFVSYFPLDILDDSSYIEITSNDPLTPVAYADQDGIGSYEKFNTDTFEQDKTVDVDLLFVVDNSGSMLGNQVNLKNNFASFMNTFAAAGVSYQIALITTDNPDFVGDVISNTTPDPVVEFNSQIDSIGTRGSTTEAGLWAAYESTVFGDASSSSPAGFLRTSARLVVVYVSDEKDHTTSKIPSMVPYDYTTSLLSLKASSDLIIAHAIAGDYPSGCTSNGGAQYGEGYYDVVNSLSGTFMSICDSDWSVTMDTLARDSIAMTGFPLSEKAISGTIEVKVNGIINTDWYFEHSSNSVIFTFPPLEGSDIEINYAVWSCQ